MGVLWVPARAPATMEQERQTLRKFDNIEMFG